VCRNTVAVDHHRLPQYSRSIDQSGTAQPQHSHSTARVHSTGPDREAESTLATS
jgi:hypothetical protein